MHSLNTTCCIKLNDKPDDIIPKIEVWWVRWPNVWSYGLSFSNVCMRPEFMTSMSCDGVYWMCGAAWSSRWLMTQLTNDKRACVHASGGHFKHTLWLSICYLCTWWTLCFTPCLMKRVIFKECIIKVWNVMFSFSLARVNSLFRWGGHFYMCV